MKTFVSLFSCAGVADILPKRLGYQLSLAVEYDQEMANLYRINHGNHVLVGDVLGVIPIVPNLDWLHASPSCTVHSNARNKSGVSDEERANHTALSARVAAYALECNAKLVTIENVANYFYSESFRALGMGMTLSGLYPISSLQRITASSVGLPQNRNRTVAIYAQSLDDIPDNTRAFQSVKLMDVIKWDEAIESKATQAVLDAYQRALYNRSSFPILVERIGYRGECTYVEMDRPCWTVKASIADDGKGKNGRKHFISLVNEQGECRSITPRQLARIQGIPDDFYIGNNPRIAVRAIGNALPYQMLGQAIKEARGREGANHCLVET